MTMQLEAFGGSPGVLGRLIGREDLFGEAAAALHFLGFEMATVVFEQPLAT